MRFTGTSQSGSIRDSDFADGLGPKRSRFQIAPLSLFALDLLNLRKWDALEQLLPATPATTYLGIVTGATYGTNVPQVQTGNLHAAGDTTRRGRMIVVMPNFYVATGAVQIRAVAGMLTTVADTLATVLVEAYQLFDDGTISANLVSTAALTINSLTLANKDFTLDPTNLVPGSRLDVRVSLRVNDAATGAAVTGVLQSLALRCDTQP